MIGDRKNNSKHPVAEKMLEAESHRYQRTGKEQRRDLALDVKHHYLDHESASLDPNTHA